MTNYVIINYKLLLYIIFFRKKIDFYGKNKKFKRNIKLWNYEFNTIVIIGFLICMIFFILNTILYFFIEIIHS